MSLHLQPVRVATGSDDTESQLVFSGGFLVAVLVRLSDDHGEDAGSWFLEAGFGRVNDLIQHTFLDLKEAQDWIECRLAGG
ncbi:hypothetical protein [Methylobacterium crusticola]|uniref:hypothetical protein n=1 Tax=Methylobacterium crusticola TaxID=1697972 RepID=UPI000FFBA538|nr:hypothetical protein [Methylobacterium crusticola]